jgi:hypothetical protein
VVPVVLNPHAELCLDFTKVNHASNVVRCKEVRLSLAREVDPVVVTVHVATLAFVPMDAVTT